MCLFVCVCDVFVRVCVCSLRFGMLTPNASCSLSPVFFAPFQLPALQSPRRTKLLLSPTHPKTKRKTAWLTTTGKKITLQHQKKHRRSSETSDGLVQLRLTGCVLGLVWRCFCYVFCSVPLWPFIQGLLPSWPSSFLFCFCLFCFCLFVRLLWWMIVQRLFVIV